MGPNIRERVIQTLEAAKGVIRGQESMIEAILAALACEGHLLIEGMPGLGKTLCVRVMGRLCDLSFKRVQFTPDLLPADLIGTMIYNQQKDEFSTKFGPIFTQILLGDEINRAPPKVQSALLEAMAEKQVTIGEKTWRLSDPYVVLATQNPIEQEGTYPLPEAQLDRFMMKIQISHPDFASEMSFIDFRMEDVEKIQPMFGIDDLGEFKTELAKIYIDDKIKNFIVSVVHSTRPESKLFPKEFDGVIQSGASPRASMWLYRISRFKAFLAQRDYVTPEDILDSIGDVIGHRLILSYEAHVDKIRARDVALRIAQGLV